MPYKRCPAGLVGYTIGNTIAHTVMWVNHLCKSRLSFMAEAVCRCLW